MSRSWSAITRSPTSRATNAASRFSPLLPYRQDAIDLICGDLLGDGGRIVAVASPRLLDALVNPPLGLGSRRPPGYAVLGRHRGRTARKTQDRLGPTVPERLRPWRQGNGADRAGRGVAQPQPPESNRSLHHRPILVAPSLQGNPSYGEPHSDDDGWRSSRMPARTDSRSSPNTRRLRAWNRSMQSCTRNSPRWPSTWTSRRSRNSS
jgi:hypothetical protein